MAYLKIIRPLNLFIILLTMTGFRYAYSLPEMKLVNIVPLPEISFWLALCSVILVTAAGYIVNDIFDVKADAINKPQKVYVGKTISVKNAWMYYSAMAFASILLSLTINLTFSFIVISTNIALFVYSLFIKRIALFGNMLVAFLSAIVPFLTVWLDVSFAYNNNPNDGYFSLYSFPLYVSGIAFLGSLAREIIKDLEDIEGDKFLKALTLPIILGIRKTEYLSIFIVIICCVLIFIYPPFTNDTINMIYFAIAVIAPLIVSLKSIYKATEKKHYSTGSLYLKIAMLGVVVFVWLNGFLNY
jgi:4-hydroxybenzoate polyprenyltransferase